MKSTQWMWGLWMRATLATLLGTAVGCVDASEGIRPATCRKPSRPRRRRAAWRRTPASSSPRRTRALRASSSTSSRTDRRKTRSGSRRWRRRRRRSGSRTGRRPRSRTPSARRCATRRRERRVPVLVAYNTAVPRLRAVLGGRRDRHRRVQGLDRRLRGGHRQRQGRRDPRARRAGHHPYNTTILRRRRLVQADGHRRRGNRSPRPAPAPPSATRSSTTRSTRSRPRRRARSLYLDGTHSSLAGRRTRRRIGWCKAGVQRAQGFFLNVSNYQPNDQLAQFGTWVSDCITAATAGADWAAGHFDWCPGQYDPGAGLRRQLRARVRRDRDGRARRHDGRRRRDDALRARHQPQRTGAMAPDGRLSGRAGLVQPARSAAPARARRRRPACRSPMRSSGSRSRVSRTAPATAASRARRPIPSGAASSIPPPAAGSRSRRSSWRARHPAAVLRGAGSGAALRWCGAAPGVRGIERKRIR